ncbi:hypothetical protein LzC2_41130 [Planctomycetes bacterium LzC2]|uniref:Uncharacterized protein n=1 Tax=Alienimonas chondri TaxID=2681879 RepID=A0ABX1VIP4_9PLAN|nr:hypothetical protein [Alienimonas chondri]
MSHEAVDLGRGERRFGRGEQVGQQPRPARRGNGDENPGEASAIGGLERFDCEFVRILRGGQTVPQADAELMDQHRVIRRVGFRRGEGLQQRAHVPRRGAATERVGRGSPDERVGVRQQRAGQVDIGGGPCLAVAENLRRVNPHDGFRIGAERREPVFG